jgi:glycosyltransferase involved in cell wall biosynthesis
MAVGRDRSVGTGPELAAGQSDQAGGQIMSLQDTPLVSVLTPVYNGADFLAECIESVLNQTYQNYEYIIVNNCSKDRTLEIAQHYAAKDRRIRVHNNQEFVGVIANHNIAFNLISPQARYCKVVSGDDYIFADCIARMVEFAEANPSVGIIGAYQLSGEILKWQGFRYPKTVYSGLEVGRRCFLQDQVFVEGEPIFGFGTPTSLMYRADLVRESKEFYPNASPHADTSTCFKYLQKSDFGFIYQVLSYERTHGDTQSSTSAKINRYSSAILNDLVQYGSFYLAKDEWKKQIDLTLESYYRFLAWNYLVGHQDAAFWSYHKGRLAELGYPLSRFALLKAAAAAIFREGLNPVQAVGKVRKHLFSKPAQVKPPAPQPEAGDCKTVTSKQDTEQLAAR